MREYTATEATREVLGNMPEGRKYTGRQLHEMIVRQLRMNGSKAEPYDSTTLRLVRSYASLYNVRCIQAGQKSKYIKGDV